MAKKKLVKLAKLNCTVLPAQVAWLEKVREDTGQTVSDTVRRAIEMYIKSQAAEISK